MQACSKCENHVPDATNFCPFCGTEMMDRPRVTELIALDANESSPTIREAAVMVDPSIEAEIRAAKHEELIAQKTPLESAETMEPLINPALSQFNDIGLPFDDDLEFVPPRRPLKAYAAVITSVALIVGVIGFAVWKIPAAPEAPVEVAAAVIDEVAPVLEPVVEAVQGVLPSEFAAKTGDHKESIITHNEKPLATLYSSRGSRYDSIEKRSEAVQLRLQHVASTTHATPQTPHFETRKQGGVYEIVWARGEQKFRILDVTKADFRSSRKHGKALGKTHADVANVIAGRLNEVFSPSEPSPNS